MDPVTFAVVAVTLALVALAASFIPAARAAAADPTAALYGANEGAAGSRFAGSRVRAGGSKSLGEKAPDCPSGMTFTQLLR